jgi:two-component system nitrate/nitrite response regulator NarL
MNQTWRVLIVDDHPVVRRGLRLMLEAEAWVEEVVEAPTVAAAVKEATTTPVRVVAMDVVLPDGDGVEATRRILQARPDTRVLMLSMTGDEDVVSRALQAGAHGYVLKDQDPDDLVNALRTVAAGGVVLGPKIGPRLLTDLRRGPATLPPPFDQLTERERTIVARLGAGDNNARIARELGLNEKTVRNYLSTIFTKLGVTDRVQAALLARDAKITGYRPGG